MARRGLLAAGALTLVVLWLTPIENLAVGPFSAFMLTHMGVVAVGAPLVALGLAGGPLDPVRTAPKLFGPAVACAVELIVVWGWHAPALHHAARTSGAVFAVEQASFLVGGLLVWLSAFGGDAPPRSGRRATGLAVLLLTSMHMTLLGALLALPPRPLYASEGSPVGIADGARSAAPTALEDQHLGGAIMIGVGGVSYLAGGLALAVGLLRGAPSFGPVRGAAPRSPTVASGRPTTEEASP